MVFALGCSTMFVELSGAVGMELVNGGVDGGDVVGWSVDATPIGRSVLYCVLYCGAVASDGILVGTNEGGVCVADCWLTGGSSLIAGGWFSVGRELLF